MGSTGSVHHASPCTDILQATAAATSVQQACGHSCMSFTQHTTPKGPRKSRTCFFSNSSACFCASHSSSSRSSRSCSRRRDCVGKEGGRQRGSAVGRDGRPTTKHGTEQQPRQHHWQQHECVGLRGSSRILHRLQHEKVHKRSKLAAAPHRAVHVELAAAGAGVGAHDVVAPVRDLLHDEPQLLIQLLGLPGGMSITREGGE